MSKTVEKFVCHVHEDQHCARPDGRNPHAFYNDEPSLTQQDMSAESDINNIVARALKGLPVHVNHRQGRYMDVSNIPDFAEAHRIVIQAQQMFASLDANVRERFNNDPEKMIEFLKDEKNRDEAVKLGLMNPVASPKVDPVLEEVKGMRADLKASHDANRKKRSDGD